MPEIPNFNAPLGNIENPGRERALALRAVLRSATDMGLERAVAKYGQSLSNTEIELIKSLSAEELRSFHSVGDRWGFKPISPVADTNIVI